MLGNFSYSNPTKLYFGEHSLEAVSVSAYCEEDPWEKYYLRMEDADNKIIPVGCVLTMVGTGSEMNGGSVITHHGQKRKIGHVFGDNVFPKFSILNPVFTFTLPKYQMTAGFFDIMSHILEQYFSGEDDNTSDYIMEGLERMEAYMRELGLVMSVRELGVTEDMLDGIADGSFLMEGGYKTLTHEEIVGILKESMRART